MSDAHIHDFVEVVRRKGNSVRKKCVCAHIGPWVKQVKDTTPIPSNNPVVLRTLTVHELREKAKAERIRGISRMNKEQLIEVLTQV